MSLAPGPVERLARARADLRIGLPVLLCAGRDGGHAGDTPRGNTADRAMGGTTGGERGEAGKPAAIGAASTAHATAAAGQASGRAVCALVLAAETLTPERLADLRALGRPILAITARRATTLKAQVYDGDLARLEMPDQADTVWVRAVADPADDLSVPMKGPFRSQRGGSAAIHRAALALCKQAQLLPAAVVLELDRDPAIPGLGRVDLAEVGPLINRTAPHAEVVSARVPLQVSQAGRVHVFRPEDGGEEQYAVEIGAPDRSKPVLARLHSACFTGDLIGSLKCDCGAQLRAALDQIGREGAGVLLYLNQEGRGIGLANKMRAYSLQDQGFDTVEANHRLGFEDDERDFRIGAELLRALGFSQVRLMTNNPAKVAMMEASGIRVAERVPLRVGRTEQNAAYLATKAAKSGHLL